MKLATRWTELSDLSAHSLLRQPDRHMAYLVLERYWNDGSPSGHRLEMPDQWSPFSPSLGYRLPVRMVANDRVTVVTDPRIDCRLIERIDQADWHPFPLHPSMLAQFPRGMMQPDCLADPLVSPTASGRTVALLNERGEIDHFLKLDYPHRLGRFGRDLSLFKWLASLERSRLFSQASDGAAGWEFMREAGGAYFETPHRAHGIGFLLRPFEVVIQDGAHLIPSFSLWARPRQGSQTVLSALRIMFGWNEQEAFASLVVPVVEAYFSLALSHGLLPELNAQNLLYVIREDGSCRPCFRDMQDVFIDDDVRARRNLGVGGVSYKRVDRQSTDLAERRSFSYDFKLGAYVLEPLLKELAGSASAAEYFRARVKDIARRSTQDWPEYWPQGGLWYSYSSSDAVDRSTYLESISPRWR